MWKLSKLAKPFLISTSAYFCTVYSFKAATTSVSSRNEPSSLESGVPKEKKETQKGLIK